MEHISLAEGRCSALRQISHSVKKYSSTTWYVQTYQVIKMSLRNTPSFTQSEVAIQIERLVDAIECTDRQAFEIVHSPSGEERVHHTRLSRYFDSIQQMFDLFDDRTIYTYSEYLQAFWQSCQNIGLERGPAGLTCLNELRTVYLDFEHSMNALVA